MRTVLNLTLLLLFLTLPSRALGKSAFAVFCDDPATFEEAGLSFRSIDNGSEDDFRIVSPEGWEFLKTADGCSGTPVEVGEDEYAQVEAPADAADGDIDEEAVGEAIERVEAEG